MSKTQHPSADRTCTAFSLDSWELEGNDNMEPDAFEPDPKCNGHDLTTLPGRLSE